MQRIKSVNQRVINSGILQIAFIIVVISVVFLNTKKVNNSFDRLSLLSGVF